MTLEVAEGGAGFVDVYVIALGISTPGQMD
jgi:hypothetical protein